MLEFKTDDNQENNYKIHKGRNEAANDVVKETVEALEYVATSLPALEKMKRTIDGDIIRRIKLVYLSIQSMSEFVDMLEKVSDKELIGLMVKSLAKTEEMLGIK